MFFLLAISFLAIISTSYAADITIGPNTPGGLKQAIATAKSGDTIYMENGVYSGANNRMIEIDKNISIRGKGKNVVIDGQKKNYMLFTPAWNRDVWGYYKFSLTLTNLKITKFKTIYLREENIIINAGSLTINNCTFSENKIGQLSELITNQINSTCKITNSIFTKNYLANGAEGSASAFHVKNGSNLIISKCKFNNNIGGGFTIRNGVGRYAGGTVNVTGCSFNNDGRSILNGNKMVIFKSTFKNAQGSPVSNYGNMKVIDSAFIKNNGGESGAIYNTGNITIINSLFKNNKARDSGAIMNWGIMTIQSSTFTSNIAIGDNKYNKGVAGAIYNYKDYRSPGVLKITNTKFKNNIAGTTYKAIVAVEFKTIKGKNQMIKGKFTKKNVIITPKDGFVFWNGNYV